MSQDSVSTMDPTEMSSQELLADTQKTNVTDDFNKVTLASQTSEMDWEYTDVFSEEISLCQDYIDHYKNLTDYYTTLKETLVTQGLEQAKEFLKENKESKKQPSNLKQVLNDCFKGGSKTKAKKLNQLDGLELLEKLKRHVYNQTTHQTNNLPSFHDKETNIEQIKSYLVVCNNFLKRNQSGILKIVVVYGQWLHKLKSHHFGRFKSICTEILQISPSWCHKLYKISALFKRFPKLQELSLSITEAAQLIKKIDSALQSHADHQ